MAPTTPRRILVLNERDLAHPRAGGAEIHLARIFSRLAARGHTIVQVSAGFRDGASRAAQDGIVIERRRPLVAYYAGIPARLRRARREREFDVVVDCLNKLPFYAPLLAGGPVLALCHHLFGTVAYEEVAWPIASAVVLAESGLARAYRNTPFLAISESTRDDLVARGIDAERIKVSHPGIDPPTIAVDPDPERPPRLVYVGRLARYKRVDLLLRAAARLTDRFPALEITIIGRGPERAMLERLADGLALAERTHFTGFVDDRERDRLLAGAAVCAFPSEKEGWGLSVIEANAVATPVVARDAQGLRDSIRHGNTGWLVDLAGADDEQAARRFAAALEAPLAGGERARATRREALAWSKRFDWERAADEAERAIEDAILDHRGPRR